MPYTTANKRNKFYPTLLSAIFQVSGVEPVMQDLTYSKKNKVTDYISKTGKTLYL